MKRKRYTTEQVIGFLKVHEAGAKVADLTRKHGFSEQSFYRWKSKYSGFEVSEAKRLKELEHENARLKKLLRVCRLIRISRKAIRYAPQRPHRDVELVADGRRIRIRSRQPRDNLKTLSIELDTCRGERQKYSRFSMKL